MSDINLNMAECLRTVTHIGYHRVHNVCSGAVTDIPWGPFQWLGLPLVALGILAIVFFVWAIKPPRGSWRR